MSDGRVPLRVNDRPSCINRLRVRSPHSGAVRIWRAAPAYSAVADGNAIARVHVVQQEVAVGMERCGAITYAAATSVPPLIDVPDGAVRIAGAWQTAQPTWVNKRSPCCTSALTGPREGAFVERMKFANALTFRPCPPDPAPDRRLRHRPLALFSVGSRGEVTPISLR
ncbi:MAG: hypothetical protein U1F35_14790 [Steroidobacteraceae bacterium]